MTIQQQYSGVFTALITPFLKNGSVDEPRLRTLVESQIQAGISGLVPVGTTGESPTVTHKENIQIVKIVVDQAAGRVPVVAGTGSNSTAEAIDMTGQAMEIGATASLQVAPYYNKPNQDGLHQHFHAIAEQVDLPMIIYNIPGRTGVNLATPTLLSLAEHANILGVKEASGNLGQMMDVLAGRPDDFTLLSGDDNITLPVLLLGGNGVISVASNIIPEQMISMVTHALEGAVSQARALHYRLLPLFKAMFSDTNPIPVKYALSRLGRCEEIFRLPMCSPSEEVKQGIDQVLRDLSLL
ncbi:4-hydroxy-tetrahydrodipicolinate synthase [Spirochaeta lutea]|uniref:4-hydroxy-tetrahydrodipicolinate synthase n=1 Tax=Spirochaeta lutea TaxID=1480694 RepID=A0A098QUK0_9SPIO|nr:4-hydroxy-tetrahydrodipicolinate synthase [Spirochaeta lutea]KGE71083.1 dihydrodipicolinate synthase [Spirochaeta lutea]